MRSRIEDPDRISGAGAAANQRLGKIAPAFGKGRHGRKSIIWTAKPRGVIGKDIVRIGQRNEFGNFEWAADARRQAILIVRGLDGGLSRQRIRRSVQRGIAACVGNISARPIHVKAAASSNGEETSATSSPTSAAGPAPAASSWSYEGRCVGLCLLRWKAAETFVDDPLNSFAIKIEIVAEGGFGRVPQYRYGFRRSVRSARDREIRGIELLRHIAGRLLCRRFGSSLPCG